MHSGQRLLVFLSGNSVTFFSFTIQRGKYLKIGRILGACEKLSGLIDVMASAIWFILPAYFANAAPILLGGGAPLDLGKKFVDGRRIFGKGKTIRGFACGLVVGTLVGLLQGIVRAPLREYLLLGFLLALGALLGDLASSFIKRRLGIKSGGAAPGLDQLSFVVVALILASLVRVLSLQVIATILIITPPIHLATNFIGYKLGLKGRPY
jgi:CDP-2,3-bis-(O-geranylgeranyl)-sn-glycerol synthase